MKLTKSEHTLNALKRYLKAIGFNASDIKIAFDPEAENYNKQKKPRYFCYTTPKSNLIRSSVELENVPERVRTAIVLHEIGHILLKAFGNDTVEVDVDTFCTEITDGDYKMQDKLRYVNKDGDVKLARSVETVSGKFLQEVGLDDE